MDDKTEKDFFEETFNKTSDMIFTQNFIHVICECGNLCKQNKKRMDDTENISMKIAEVLEGKEFFQCITALTFTLISIIGEERFYKIMDDMKNRNELNYIG